VRGVKGRVLSTALALLICAGGAAAATTRSTAAKNPAFNVTVTSSIFQHHITHIVRKADQSGCRWRSDIDTAQTLSTRSRQPVRMTLEDLAGGGQQFVGVAATLRRTGTSYTGWEPGCPLLANEPATHEPAGACGKTKHFFVSQSLTSVGYATPRSSNFRFLLSGQLPDPYGTGCLAPFWGGGTDGSLTLDAPPQPWLIGKTKKKWWTVVNRSRLLSGKPVVVHYRSTGTVATPTTSDPSAYEESVYTDYYAVSWTVTLKPTK
jgi:hypothetical protein